MAVRSLVSATTSVYREIQTSQFLTASLLLSSKSQLAQAHRSVLETQCWTREFTLMHITRDIRLGFKGIHRDDYHRCQQTWKTLSSRYMKTLLLTLMIQLLLRTRYPMILIQEMRGSLVLWIPMLSLSTKRSLHRLGTYCKISQLSSKNNQEKASTLGSEGKKEIAMMMTPLKCQKQGFLKLYGQRWKHIPLTPRFLLNHKRIARSVSSKTSSGPEILADHLDSQVLIHMVTILIQADNHTMTLKQF